MGFFEDQQKQQAAVNTQEDTLSNNPIKDPIEKSDPPVKKVKPEDIKLTPEEKKQVNRQAEEALAYRRAPSSYDATKDIEINPELNDPYLVQMGFVQKFGRSLVKGVGDQIIGSTGEMLDFANLAFGADVADGNIASNWLKEVGTTLSAGMDNHTSQAYREHMEKNAWSLKTFMYPDFWSNEIAKGIPMAVEMIFLSKGVSGMARNTTKSYLKKRAIKQGVQSVDDITGVLSKTSSPGKAVNVLNSKATKAFELSNVQSSALDAVTGGITMNTLAGLQNAAEMVNQYKLLEDENGNKVYSDDDLKTMAASSMINNMKYLPVDMMSWGVSFGLGSKSLNKGINKFLGKTKNYFNKSEQLRYASTSFGATVNPMLKKIGKIGLPLSKAGLEGFEETFQESFEEWSKQKGLAKVTGKMKYENFFDFYMSKENEHTKAVAMGLGGLMGGGSQMAQSIVEKINNEADIAYKTFDKAELIKNNIKTTDYKTRASRIDAVKDQLLNNKYHGGIDNQVYIKALHEKGQLTDEEAAYSIQQAEIIDQAWEQGDQLKMNVSGKFAYVNAVSNQNFFQDELKLLKEEYEANTKTIKDKITDEKELIDKQEKLNNDYLKQNLIIKDQLYHFKMAQQSLLSGKKGKVEFNYAKNVKDQKGETQFFDGLSELEYIEFYGLSDEEIISLSRKSNNAKRGYFGRVKDRLSKQFKERYEKLAKFDPKDDLNSKPKKDAKPTDEKGKKDTDETADNKTTDNTEAKVSEESQPVPEQKTDKTEEVKTPVKKKEEAVKDEEETRKDEPQPFTKDKKEITYENGKIISDEQGNIEVNDIIKEEKKVIEEPKVVENKKKSFFMATPLEDGSFEASSSHDAFTEGKSSYKFTQISDTEAEFEIDKRSSEFASRSPEIRIHPMTTPLNAHTAKGTITTVEKGISELVDGKWVLKKKAKIKYDDSPYQTEEAKVVEKIKQDNKKTDFGIDEKGNIKSEHKFKSIKDYDVAGGMKVVVGSQKAIREAVSKLSDLNKTLNDPEIKATIEYFNAKLELLDAIPEIEKKYNQDADQIIKNLEDSNIEGNTYSEQIHDTFAKAKKARETLSKIAQKKNKSFNAELKIEGSLKNEINETVDRIYDKYKNGKSKPLEIESKKNLFGPGSETIGNDGSGRMNIPDKKTKETKEDTKKETKEGKKETKITKPKYIGFSRIKSEHQYREWTNQSLGAYKYGNKAISEAMALNGYLKKLYPKNKQRYMPIIQLGAIVGHRATGFAIGSAMFIEEQNWKQEELLMHEFIHPLYHSVANTKESEYIIDQAMKNKKWANNVLKRYKGFTYVELKNGDIEFLKDVVRNNIPPSEYKVLPFKNQQILKEEIFVNYMQGPLSTEYDGAFQSKYEGKRRHNSERWWKFMKDNTKNKETEYMLDFMNEGKPFMKNYYTIVQKFNEALKKGHTLGTGRYSIQADNNANAESQKQANLRDFRTAVENYNPEDKGNLDEANQIQAELVQSYINDRSEDGIADNIRLLREREGEFEGEQVEQDQQQADYDKAWERIDNKAGELLNTFFRYFTVKKNTKSNLEAIERNTVSQKYDRKLSDFKGDIMMLAKNNDYQTFTNTIIQAKESVNEEAYAFNKYLDRVYGKNKHLMLSSMHVLYHNTVTTPLIETITDENGNVTFEQENSLQEDMQINMILNNIDENINMEYYNAEIKAFETYYDVIERFMNNQETVYDYKNVLKPFIKNYFKVDEILESNSIILKEQYVDVKTFVDHYFKGSDNIIGFDENNRALQKEMMGNISATARPYTDRAVVINPESNPTSSKHLGNALTQIYEEMNIDLKSDMSNEDFIAKYKNSRNKSIYNEYLNFLLKERESGKYPTLSMHSGDINNMNNKKIAFKDSDSQSNFAIDFMSFLIDPSDSYISSLNAFGNSRRRFVTRQPKHQTGRVSINNAITLGSSIESKLKNAWKIYRQDNEGFQSFEKYKRFIKNEIKENIAYFNNNADIFSKLEATKDLYTKGQLNRVGKKKILDHELSTIINKTSVSELLTPGVKAKNNTKYNKLNISPRMVIGDMTFDNVIFNDDVLEGTDLLTTDSGQFILDTTAKRLSERSMGLIDLNYGFKFVNMHHEKNNDKYTGKSIALKGYTTILSPEQVKKFPKLKPIYDALVEREAKFLEYAKKNNVEVSETYGDGKFDYIGIASPLTSVKIDFLTKGQQERMKKVGTIKDENPEFDKEYFKLLDEINYKEDKFVGFEGKNLGVQMRMDIKRNQSKLPIQIWGNIVALGSVTGNMEQSENVISLLNEAIKDNADSKLLNEIMPDGKMLPSDKLAEFLLKHINEFKADPKELYLLKNITNKSIHNPKINENTKNLVRNLVIRYLNNISMQGTIAQQKSEMSGKPIVLYNPKTKEQRTIYRPLNDYGKDHHDKTKPMEMIMPGYTNTTVRKRKYCYTDESFSNSLTPDILKEFNLRTEEDVAKFKINNTIVVENKNIYYIPGERVVVTRVPASGPNFTGVAEVVDFDTTGAANAMTPTEFNSRIGSDHDGDQLFINYKQKKKESNKRKQPLENNKFNDFLDGFFDLWLDPKVKETIQTGLDNVSTVDQTIANIKKKLGKVNPDIYDDNGAEILVPFGNKWAKRNQNNALAASQSIGIAFNDLRLYNVLSGYDIELTKSNYNKPQKVKITIDGQTEDKFTNNRSDKGQRMQNANTLANIILDSITNSQTEALNINKYTASFAMALTNLGFDLEKVGLFLNQDIVKEYIDKIKTKDFLYSKTETTNKVLTEMSNDLDKKNIWDGYNDKTSFNITLNNSNKKSDQFQILQLIHFLNGINSDIQTLNKIMRGHKNIDNDASIIRKQLSDLNDLFENDSYNSSLQLTDEFKKSPLLEIYRNSNTNAEKILKAMSVENNSMMEDMNTYLKASMYDQEISEYSTRKLSKQLKSYNYARVFGINNYSKKYLEDIITSKNIKNGLEENNENSIFYKLQEHTKMLSNQNVEWIDGNRISDLERNEFLGRGIVMDAGNRNSGEDYGKIKIWLSKEATSPYLTNTEIQAYKDGFEALPEDIQKELLIADLILNNWSDKHSIFPFVPDRVIEKLNKGINALNIKQDISPENNLVKAKLKKAILTKEMNEKWSSIKTLNVNYNPNETVGLMQEDIGKIFKDILSSNNYRNGFFRTDNKNNLPIAYYQIRRYKNGKPLENEPNIYLKLTGFTKQQLSEYYEPNVHSKRKFRADDFKTNKPEQIGRTSSHLGFNTKNYKLSEAEYLKNTAEFIVPEKDSYGNIDMMAIESSNGSFDPFDNIDELFKQKELSSKKKDNKEVNFDDDSGRFNIAETHYYQNRKLSRQDFFNVQQYKRPMKQGNYDVLYRRYKRDKAEAEQLVKLKDLTPENIANKSTEELMAIYEEYGYKDQYAFASILVPTLLELTRRKTKEQSDLTKRYEDGKDVGYIKSWFQTNNIDSNHPATQAVQKELEIEFKKFQREKSQYSRRIAKVTEALYRSKFKDIYTPYKFVNKLARASRVLFTDRKKMYEHLYGNIVDEQYSETGEKAIRLKSKNKLNQLYKENKITKQEYDFANNFREIITELNKGKKLEKGINDFVPAVGMTRMEAFSNRGLLGLFANSRTADEAIYDVVMEFNGEQVKFKEIEDHYKIKAVNNFKNIREYIEYKQKAILLTKKGENENGTPLEVSTVSNNTMLGSGFVNRFTKNNYQFTGDMMSMDLDKVLHDFVHASLFTSGGKQFKGFLKLQALVDGLLIHNNIKGFKNQNKFVLEVYKEGFLNSKRKRKKSLTDQILNGMVRGNLLYILGYKALLLQGGLYAVGNAMVGKYHNIKQLGKRRWILGEMRFWGIDKGIPNVKRSLGILNTLNFNDYNVYDDVNMDKEAGIGKIFSDIALMPMIQSEKWIQGVHMLGMLSESQMNKFDENGKYIPGTEPISDQEITEMENDVTKAHGKGYNMTNQRLVQQYSWGNMMMQFSRFIPTMFYDRFAKEDINIYGKKHIGSLRQVAKTVNQIVSGKMTPQQFGAYYKSLDAQNRLALKEGLRGMAMVTAAAFMGQAFEIDQLTEMTGDANYIINQDKLEYKSMPSLIRTILGIF